MDPREVLVVGAGPVGLSLGLRLAKLGRKVLVVDKKPALDEHSRAPAIWPRTQEVLAELGVMDAFLREGIKVPALELHDVDRGRVAFRAPIDQLANETEYPHLLVLPQPRTEALLLEALQREPTAEVLFSHEVVEMTQFAHFVDVTMIGPEKKKKRLEAQVVVGCDGAHSICRETIFTKFEGITYPIRAALADIRIGNSSDTPFPRFTTAPRIAIGIRIAEDLWRLILPYPESESIPLDTRVRDAASRLFGDRPYEDVWQSEFQIHRKVSAHFSRRRIALAGDAAHLNSPVGGQGMNAGIQDTVPLVKAIELTLDFADPAHIDRYAHERQWQVKRGVNSFTDKLTRALLGDDGKNIRRAFALATLATRIPPIRRMLLRKLTMLDTRPKRRV